jgi:hypothetical protein
MQRKIVVMHHGHSLSATGHIAHAVRTFISFLEAVAMIATYGARAQHLLILLGRTSSVSTSRSLRRFPMSIQGIPAGGLKTVRQIAGTNDLRFHAAQNGLAIPVEILSSHVSERPVMNRIIGVRRLSVWLLTGLIITGCGTASAPHSANADSVRPGNVPVHSRTELSQELHDQASYLRQVADRRERQADELAKKVGPEDEGVIYRTRSLADQIRKQAEAVDQKARDLAAASSDRMEDHVIMAQFYQQVSERLESEAEQYAEEASAITPLQDPKGIRRDTLLTIAEQHWQQAAEMKKRVTLHGTKAGPGS